MNRNFPILILTGLALAAGLAWFSFRSAHEAAQALSLLSQQRDSLDARIYRTAAEVSARHRQCLRLQAALMDEQTRPRPAASAAGAAWEDRITAVLATNPKAFDVYLEGYHTGLRQQFGPLYRSLGLSPAQIDKFEDLMTEHEEIALSLRAAALAQGEESPTGAVAGLQEQEDERLRAAQISLLGNDGYGQWQSFERVRPVWPLVDEIASYVALTPAPLTGAQAAQLLQILAGASQGYRQGGQASPDRAQIEWNEVLRQAPAVLSQNQLAGVTMLAGAQRLAQLKAKYEVP